MIIVAYACRKDQGSEPDNGWNWCKSAIDYHRYNNRRCIIFTREENKLYIPKKYRHYFRFIKSDRLPSLPLDIHVYLNYLLWQFIVLFKLRKMSDKVWHINYGSYFLGTLIGLIKRDCYYGPIGGAQKIPKSLKKYLMFDSPKDRLREKMIDMVKFSPIHRLMYSKLNTIFASNKSTEAALRQLGASRIILECDSGIELDKIDKKLNWDNMTHKNLFWVGRMFPFKGLNIALEMITFANNNYFLDIYGAGLTEKSLKTYAICNGIDDLVSFKGYLDKDDIEVRISSYSFHIFMSLRDSFGAQILEAAAKGVPTVALNINGASDFLNNENAILIDPDELSKFGPKLIIEKMNNAEANLEKLRVGALKFAESQTWDNKINRIMKEIYG